MAIFHLSIKIIGRSHGATAVAKAAYRSGTRLKNERTGLIHDFTKKYGVGYSEVILCKNAPSIYRNREILWNEVEKVEKNKNAQYAREIEFALPIEFDEQTRLEVARTFLQTFADEGMCVDWSYHNREFGNRNPHVHAMLTTRGIREDGSWDAKERKAYAIDENGEKIPVIDPKTGLQKIGPKGRKMWERVTVQKNDWNDPGNAEKWRLRWEEIVNSKMDELGLSERIDRRSYARQGLDIEPTIHEGVSARKMEAKGYISDRCQINREIRERNRIRKWIKEKVRELTGTILEKVKLQFEKMQRFLTNQIGGNYEPDRTIRDHDRDHGSSAEVDPDYRGAGGNHRQFDGTDRTIDELGERVDRTKRTVGRVDGRIDGAKQSVGRLDDIIDGTEQFLDDINGGLGRTEQFLADISGGIDETEELLGEYGERTDGIKRSASGSGKQIADLEARIKRREEEANESIRKIFERYQQRQSDAEVGKRSEGLEEKVRGLGSRESGYSEGEGFAEIGELETGKDQARELINNLRARERAAEKERQDRRPKQPAINLGEQRSNPEGSAPDPIIKREERGRSR